MGLWGLVLAVSQGCRGVLWLAWWPTWQDVPLRLPFWVLGGMSLAWAGLFFVWFWAWWSGWEAAPRAFPGLVALYLGYWWMDRLVWSASPLVRIDAPYALVRTGVLLLAAWGLARHPKTLRYFGVPR